MQCSKVSGYAVMSPLTAYLHMTPTMYSSVRDTYYMNIINEMSTLCVYWFHLMVYFFSNCFVTEYWFTGLLAENGRLRNLNGVINSYKVIMAAHRGDLPCEVITAKVRI